MSIKSQILKDEFQKALRLKNKTDGDIENEREKYSEEIERNQNNIKDCLTRLRDYHESKRKLIAKIRNIMETASNHEDGLLYNKLKKNKEEEYTREISNFNYLIRNDITRNEEYQINQERNFIRQNKANYNSIENLSLSYTDEAIENGRKRIIKLSIGFLKNNKENQDNIKELERRLNEN